MGLSPAGDRSVLACLCPSCFSLLRRNFVILLNCYLSIVVQKGWAHELDHIDGGTGRVVFVRAGRRLSVRPLHTRSGSLRKRQRSPDPRGELPAPREAPKDLIARDIPCQSAARGLRRAPPALRTTDPAGIVNSAAGRTRSDRSACPRRPCRWRPSAR